METNSSPGSQQPPSVAVQKMVASYTIYMYMYLHVHYKEGKDHTCRKKVKKDKHKKERRINNKSVKGLREDQKTKIRGSVNGQKAK